MWRFDPRAAASGPRRRIESIGAPDLLAALKNGVEQIEYLYRRLSKKERAFTVPTTETALNQARAAIEKAEAE